MLRRTALSVAALAAAALLLESALTRLLAVAQYYHFAFLVVSLALLGFGASGTFLSLRKSHGSQSSHLPPGRRRFRGEHAVGLRRRQLAAVRQLYHRLGTPAAPLFRPLLPGPGAALFLQRRRHRRGAGDRRRARAPGLRREPPGVGIGRAAGADCPDPCRCAGRGAGQRLDRPAPGRDRAGGIWPAFPIFAQQMDRCGHFDRRRGRLRRARRAECPGPRAAGSGDLTVQGPGVRPPLSRRGDRVREAGTPSRAPMWSRTPAHVFCPG